MLKGGTDAPSFQYSHCYIDTICIEKTRLDTNIVTLLPAGRGATADLMDAVGYVDLIIPRGGKGLIDYVRNHSKIPVIETGAGICHTYFDAYADIEKGKFVIFNAKTRRVSVCNALDCLVIHQDRLSDLPVLCEQLAEEKVIIYADEPAYQVLHGKYPFLERAQASSYGTEFLDYKMSVKTVSSIEGAIEHISLHSSKQRMHHQ